MRSLYNYIISTENRYNNKKLLGDKELILNTEITERDHHFVNRIGKVISVPININTPVKPGDYAIVHHNVFRRWFDVRGNERNSGSYIDENIYTVYSDQLFAYKNSGEWRALPDFCFVAPVAQDSKWSVLSEKELVGELIYTNSYLDSLGMSCGDIVGFTPSSEYEFNIEDKKLYRIRSNDIAIKYGAAEKNN
jgi:hypothetical protein